MLHFIPAWYQQNNWCEDEQNWHARRMHTEFDDTVKQIQLFHRSKMYPFQILLLSFAPNLRHFLHRQSVYRAPYWSCFDAIQEVRRKQVMILSVHNLNWPEHIEFLYTPFVMVAMLKGEKYAQVEYGEDGNPIKIDLYQGGVIQRRNIYDDRGFVSSTIIYENEVPLYQDYVTEKGVWKLRHFFKDGHVEINPRNPKYLLMIGDKEVSKDFAKTSYEKIDLVIQEVLSSYVDLLDEKDVFCVAMHGLHAEVINNTVKNSRMILSFYENRFSLADNLFYHKMAREAAYIIADSRTNVEHIRKALGMLPDNIKNITPFDSRVDFGISQQLNVQKVLVPVDGLDDKKFVELIQRLGEYLPWNENVQFHLFTRLADYDRKRFLLAKTRECLKEAGMEEGWAAEVSDKKVAENTVDGTEKNPVKFFVEQCVDEFSVSKCMREQRLIVDMRNTTELYLRITAISVGIPQIVFTENQFVEDGQNGLVMKDMEQIPDALAFYLENLTNWNEAMVYSYELGKRYTTNVLIEQWKEVIDFVGCD